MDYRVKPGNDESGGGNDECGGGNDECADCFNNAKIRFR